MAETPTATSHTPRSPSVRGSHRDLYIVSSFSWISTPGGYTIQCWADRVHVCTGSANQFGSSKVPPAIPRIAGHGFCCPRHRRPTGRTKFRFDPSVTFIRAVFIGFEDALRDCDRCVMQNTPRSQRHCRCGADITYNGIPRSGSDPASLRPDTAPFHKDTHLHVYQSFWYPPVEC